jgi:hypothetical protein
LSPLRGCQHSPLYLSQLLLQLLDNPFRIQSIDKQHLGYLEVLITGAIFDDLDAILYERIGDKDRYILN